MNYALFYNYNLIGDVLLIIIKPEQVPNRIEKNDDVVALYHNEELVGVNIFNISQVIKIKSTGLIVLPANAMIDVINHKLKNCGIPMLDYILESGFKIGKVLTCAEHEESDHLHVLTVDIGSEILDIVCGAANVRCDQFVVVATIGTTMFDGSHIVPSSLRGVNSNGMLCSMKELHLENASKTSGILVLDCDAVLGSDFFKVKGGIQNA